LRAKRVRGVWLLSKTLYACQLSKKLCISNERNHLKGKALVFDGSDDYVQVADSNSLDISDDAIIRKRNIYIQEIQNMHEGEYYEYIAY